MFPKFHPNTKSAFKLVLATLLLAAGVSSLLYFAPGNEVERIAFSPHSMAMILKFSLLILMVATWYR